MGTVITTIVLLPVFAALVLVYLKLLAIGVALVHSTEHWKRTEVKNGNS